MKQKSKEHENQFTVWMSASIVLHLLVILVAFFWYLELSLKNLFRRKQSVHQSTEQQKPLSAIPHKKEEPLVYTLIPGRKAVTESQATTEKKQPTPEHTQETQKSLEQPKPLEQIPKNHTKRFTIPKPQQQRIDQIKKQLVQPKDHIKQEETNNHEPIKTDEPTISKPKVTLQDLKLGFAKFLNEGNNDVLLQHGNTNQTPDAKSLRLITYNQQIARTMKESIVTHNQYDQLKEIRGKVISLVITLERNGKLVNLTIIQPSGHTLLDKVALESLREIKLYPAVPKHIEQVPYTMKWNLLF